MGETSGGMVYFEAVQPIGITGAVESDLDEITKYHDRTFSDPCRKCGGLKEVRDISEYIEIDVDTTRILLRNDDSDMSITDTIHSSKNSLSYKDEKEKDLNDDWEMDKENIAIDTYVAPAEPDIFAVNIAPDFDGNKLKYASSDADLDELKDPAVKRSSIKSSMANMMIIEDQVPSLPEDMEQASTSREAQNLPNIRNKKEGRSIIYDAQHTLSNMALIENISLGENRENENVKTIVFNKDDTDADISATSCITNKFTENDPPNRTYFFNQVYSDSNVTVTTVVPIKIHETASKLETFKKYCPLSTINTDSFCQDESIELRTVHEKNISSNATKPNLLPAYQCKTVVLNVHDGVPNFISDNPLQLYQNTNIGGAIIYEGKESSVHSNLNLQENIIATQAVPKIIKYNQDERNTMPYNENVFDNNMGNLSLTQAVPAKIITQHPDVVVNKNTTTKKQPSLNEANTQVMSNDIDKVMTNRRGTIVYEKDNTVAGMSITKAITQKPHRGDTEFGGIINRTIEGTELCSMPHREHEVLSRTVHNGVAYAVTTTSNKIPIKSQNEDGEDTTNSDNDNDANVKKNIASFFKSLIVPDQKCSKVFGSNYESEMHFPSIMQNLFNNDVGEINVDITHNSEEISLSRSKTVNSIKDNEAESTISCTYVNRTEEIDDNADLNNIQTMPNNLLFVDGLKFQDQTDTILEKPLKNIIYKEITNPPNTLNDNTDQMEDQLMPEPIQNIEPESEPQQPSVVECIDHSNKIKKSILSDLLDMSDASVVVDGYNVVAKMNTTQTSGDANTIKQTSDNTSSSSIIPIIRDSEDDIKFVTIDVNQDKELKYHGNLDEDLENTKDVKNSNVLEFQDNSIDIESELEGKLSKLKKILLGGRNGLTSENEDDKLLKLNTTNSKHHRMKSMMSVDNTKDFLEMLSNLTDDNFAQEYDKARSFSINKRIESDIRNRSEQREGSNPRSSITKRSSAAPSREKKLSSTSMARNILQKSRIEMDKSLKDTLDKSAHVSKRGKVRIAKDLVKTLHFEDDESLTEINKSNTTNKSNKSSSLKKTAFGETEYMRESNKSIIIPPYLNDISDDMKQLMGDLVKPMVDVPYPTMNKGVNNKTSTCSTQIQANLVTPSQVDLDGDLLSKSQSMVKVYTPNIVETKGNSLKEPAYQNGVEIINPSNKTWHIGEEEPKRQQGHHIQKIIDPNQGQVIYFDQNNPLNNVLLSPYGLMHIDSHRYGPVKSVDTLCTSDIMSPSEKSMSAQISFNDNYQVLNKGNELNIARVATKHNFPDCFRKFNNSECVGKPIIEENSDMLSNTVSNVSEEPSAVLLDESKLMNVKEMEVNTLIVMKPNNELLAGSSSLTLVDDALAANKFDADLDTTTRTVPSQDDMKRNNESTSNVKVIYSADGKDNALSRVKVERAATETENGANVKRKRNPTVSGTGKHKHTIECLDTIPKSLKDQKISLTPGARTRFDRSNSKRNANKMETMPENHKNNHRSNNNNNKVSSQKRSYLKKPVVVYANTPEKKKKLPKKLKVSPKKAPLRGNMTVKQLLPERNKASIVEQSKKNIETIKGSTLKCSEFIEQVSDKNSESTNIGYSISFTSSKNAHTYIRSDASKDSESTSNIVVGKNTGGGEFKILKDNYLMAEVMGKIDALPFMNTDECKWENIVGYKWSLLLLHGRVRLIVTFVRDAADGRVTPDTPIRDIEIEIAKIDKTPVALLCVRFCAECMQWVAMRTRASGAAAGALLPLVRRCAAAARVARAWGRLMIHTYAHLAYTLTEDGRLTLKVANVPLRSVWEVSMSVQMQSGDTTAGGAPRPLASDVRVTRVLSAYEVGEEEVRRVVTHVTPDWRHVPNTIWKIFKHLKQRGSDDNTLLGV